VGSSITTAILSALKTAMQGVNGAGSYTYDLSATDQVNIGAQWPPPIVPYAYIRLVRVSTADTAPLGHYGRTVECQVFGFVHATADTAQARTTAAADLMDDLMLAIESDRKLGIGVVRDVHVEATAFDGGDENFAPGFGVAGMVVTVDLARVTGA